MNQNIQTKTFLFAVRVVKLCKLLKAQRREFTLSNQLLRSGTSIGANVSEAQHAQSRADYLQKKEFDSIFSDCVEIEKILVASVKSIKKITFNFPLSTFNFQLVERRELLCLPIKPYIVNIDRRHSMMWSVNWPLPKR